jgi:DNA-binding HxlR family transcriptional regulator
MDTASEVERSFREFRESAVHLVERVADLTGSGDDPVASAHGDLQLFRSVFGKWSAEILVALHAATSSGFDELRRELSGISPRMLSLRLKGLEQRKMVHREVVDAHPPRVRYALTDRGWTLAWLAHPVFLYLRHMEPLIGESNGSRDRQVPNGT